MKRFLVFALICIVVLSITLTAFFIVQDNEIITVTKLYYQVNLAEAINIEVEIENENPDTEIVYTIIEGEENVSYSEASGALIAQNPGAVAILVSSTNKDFTPVTVNVEIGSGIESAPLFIKTVEDLQKIGNDINEFFTVDKFYKLTNNINLNSLEWSPIAPTEEDAFVGGFDFNGYTISNLTITTDMDNAGLFGVVGENAKVKGVSIANSYSGVSLAGVNIAGDFVNAGAVAGINKGTIERVVVRGEVNNTATTGTSRVGGIAGYMTYVNANTTISRSASEIDVKGRDYVGGITAENNAGVILNCYVSGTLTGGNINTVVGGITAKNIANAVAEDDYNKAIIKDCYSIATIAGVTEDWAHVVVENIHPSDTKQNIVVGTYYLTELFDLSEGVVRQDSVLNGTGFVDVDGTGDVVANYPELGVYGKNEEELKLVNTFFSHINSEAHIVNWDFGDVWKIDAEINSGYPSLILNGAFVNGGINTMANPDGDNIVTLETIRTDTEAGNTLGKVYILSEDMDFEELSIANWTPIGTEEKPFEGTLLVDIDAITGEDAKIISPVIESNGNVGLFGYVSENALIDGLTVVNPRVVADFYLGDGTEGEFIYDYANIGVIAGINKGVIQNCTIEETDILNEELNRFVETGITTGNEVTTDIEINLGAVAGINEGTISGCSTEVAVKAKTTSNRKVSVGGITGLNIGSVNKNTNANGKIIIEEDAIAYVGGIAGQSYGIVDSSYTSTFITASIDGKNYIGGLVGRMIGGTLTKSTSGAETGGGITGAYVGGIVSILKQDADFIEENAMINIAECYSNIIIEAKQAGGLAYKLEEGIVTDCYSTSEVIGAYSTSITAGFIVEMPSGVLKDSISYTNLAASRGDVYTEVYTEVRNSNKYGFLINTIYDNTKVGENSIETATTIQNADHSSWLNGIVGWFENLLGGQSGDVYNIESTAPRGMTTDEIKGSVPAGFNDDERVWEVVTGDIPKLINVASAYTEIVVE